MFGKEGGRERDRAALPALDEVVDEHHGRELGELVAVERVVALGLR